MFGVFHGVLLFLAELRAPCVRNHLDEDWYNPGAKTATDGDGPVLSSNTVPADLKGVRSKLHNHKLASRYANKNEGKHPVGVNTFENVKLVIDHAAVN